MWLTLAQSATPAESSAGQHNVFEVVTAIFRQGDALAHPQHVADHLYNLPLPWAIVFLVFGVLTMLNGFRFHKAVVVVLSGLIGAFFGYFLGKYIDSAYVVAGCLGALFAAGAWPLMKYAVAVNGGLVGAFIGANLWTALMSLSGESIQAATQHHWVGALIGLIFLGLLSFIVFKFSVVFYTSIVGATITVFGSVALLLQLWREPVASGISAHAVIMPLLVIVPAVIALILQESWGGDAPAKKS